MVWLRGLDARFPAAICAAIVAVVVATTASPQAKASSPSAALRHAAAAKALQHALDMGREKTGAPGAAVAIAVDGALAWTGQSGTADVRTADPVRASTMFSLASVSKMFVAAIVMRLVEQHRLELEESIAPYVPHYVRGAERVTVLNLLGHTSGYRDDEDDPVILRELNAPNFQWTRDDLMRREGAVTFEPGSRFRYCNSCYVMLGAVIESAGGAPVGAQFDRWIVQPLGLDGEADFDRVARFAPRIARGYDLQKGKLVDTFVGAKDLGVPTAVWGPVWTDGGVVATASGVALFTDALFAGRVVSPRSLARLLDPGPRDPHANILEKATFDGHAWRGHSGYYYGFTAESWYDASRKLTITVLTNRTDSGDPATEIWNRLTRAYDHL